MTDLPRTAAAQILMSANKKDIGSKRGKGSPRDIKKAVQKKPVFRDEALAPAVDHALLRALVRGELRETKARDVYRFVHSFKSWNDAYGRALVEAMHRT